MMKLIGSILFITACSWVGFDVSKQLNKRAHELRSFIYSLQLIEAEMAYSRHTLKDIFLNVKRKTEGEVASFYGRLAERLKKPVTHFDTLWHDELTLLKKRSTLKDNDIHILSQFGKNIGNHTIEEQKKQIILTVFYLQKQLDEAIDQKNKYDRTVKSLGFLFGLLIVLILI